MIFRAGVVAWRNTRQDLNWHLFGGMFWKDDAGKLALKNLVSKLNAHTTSGSCQVTDIYEDSGGIQFKWYFCPTQAQNQYKSGASNNDFNFDFQHFLIISSIFCMEKVVQRSNPQNHPNQPANQPGPTRKPIASQPQPRLTMTHPPTSIHPFQTKPVAPQLDVHEIRKMEKEATVDGRVVSWGWVVVFCYPP